MAKRRIRVQQVPEGADAEKVRCLHCGEVFEIERGRQFAMCPRCGNVMTREVTGRERSGAQVVGSPFALRSQGPGAASREGGDDMAQQAQGTQRFECPECGKIFTTRDQLDAHTKRGGPPPTVRAR